MIAEIYIDMDGVIADFHRRYNELFGSQAREDYLVSNNKKKDFFHKRFDEFVSSGQFATLDMLPDSHLGLEFVSGLGIPLRILSSTATGALWPVIAPQKKEWLDTHGIDIVPIFVPGKAQKKLYAGEGKVLIDDTLSVVESWRSSGGIGIHHSSWIRTISELKEMV